MGMIGHISHIVQSLEVLPLGLLQLLALEPMVGFRTARLVAQPLGQALDDPISTPLQVSEFRPYALACCVKVPLWQAICCR
eukprot:5971980-Alexandrium_andersonii.AAC.2